MNRISAPTVVGFEAILADPRRIELERNLTDFVTRYRQLRAIRQPLAWWLAQAALRNAEPADAAAFHARFLRGTRPRHH